MMMDHTVMQNITNKNIKSLELLQGARKEQDRKNKDQDQLMLLIISIIFCGFLLIYGVCWVFSNNFRKFLQTHVWLPISLFSCIFILQLIYIYQNYTMQRNTIDYNKATPLIDNTMPTM